MKYFITGAAGFVGSRLSKSLLAQGHTVVGFDNLNDYYPVINKEKNLNDLTISSRFTFIKGDLRDEKQTRQAVVSSKPDAIAHLAAMAAVRYSVQHPLIYGHVNVQGTLNLLEGAKDAGVKNCVLASTGSVYGSDTPTPFTETASASKPLAPYPASKRAMEMFAHSFAHVYDLNISILRFFNVYGPHGRPDMMPWQWSVSIQKGEPITLFNGGKMKRDWTYVDDIVRGFELALAKPHKFEIFNLGCSSPVENLEFVQVIENLLVKKAIIKDIPAPVSEPIVTWANVTKARELLGYEPKVNVAEGMKNFIQWMKEEGTLT